MAVPSNTPIKFPVRNMPAPTLVLRRRLGLNRSPLEVTEASAAARESIKNFVTSTRTPWGETKTISNDRVAELERSLRKLETLLADRERVMLETEARLAEKERELAEMEALLQAREKLVEVARKQAPAQNLVSREEQVALEQLKQELERQEASLKEAKQAIQERELFLEESENKLFEKVQAQQEKETELEQRDEELRAKSMRLREREAAIDPAAAEALKADKAAARKFNEFTE
jgi:DNA repair exonuclease SbcCD ATPase subunit